MGWITGLIPGFKTYLGASITFVGAVLAFLNYVNGTGEGNIGSLWQAVVAAGIALMGVGQRSATKVLDAKMEPIVAVAQMQLAQMKGPPK